MNITIEPNIPIPAKTRMATPYGGRYTPIFRKMKPGESFAVQVGKGGQYKHCMSAMSTIISAAKRAKTKVVCRSLNPKTVRVWKVK